MVRPVTVLDHVWFFVQTILVVAAKDAFWYLLFGGITWVLFYVLLRRVWAHRKIIPKPPSRLRIRWELLCSLRSLLVFGVMGALLTPAILRGWTRLYWRIEQEGWLWFWLSIVVMVFIHDAYFYWTHRLMHHRLLFRTFHRTHHLSTNPTPWAAYSFSIPEAFVQAGIAPVIFFTLPVHPLAFLLFMIWQIAFNVLGHSGYEIFPRWFMQTWLGVFLNTPTHHVQHHECFRSNFGLYFNLWDRLFRTNHETYEGRFVAATGEKTGETSPVPEDVVV